MKYFAPGLRHASFAPKCGHIRMSINAMHVDLSRQMKKKQQINKHASRILANLGHPNTLAARGMEEHNLQNVIFSQ